MRFTGEHSAEEVDYMAQEVADRLNRTARLGRVQLLNGKLIVKPPRLPSDDPYDHIGSVGWKADVVR